MSTEVVMGDSSNDTRGQSSRSAPAIYRVPTELWADIFRLFLDSFYMGRDPPGPDSLLPGHPLQVLINVCQTWRSIAQSMPKLWSKITLDSCWSIRKNDAPAFILRKLHILSDILQCSRDLPLEIFIRPDMDNDSSALVHQFMPMLAAHASRWAHLTVHECRQHSFSRALNSSMALLDIARFPILESISFDWFQIDGRVEESNLPQLEDKLPNLRKLYLAWGAHFLRHIPCDDLIKVELFEVPVEQQRDVLASLSAVQEIQITTDDPYGIDEPILNNDDINILPDLRRLELDSWDIHAFNLIRAPSLQEIIIRTVTPQEAQGIASFIEQSECALTSFVCSVWHTNSNNGINFGTAMEALLSSLHSVTTLAINMDGEEIRTVLEILARTTGGRISHCPSVQHLTIRSEAPALHPELLPILTEVLEIRWKPSRSGTSGLRTVAGVPEWKNLLERSIVDVISE